jgi:hypothetical protein
MVRFIGVEVGWHLVLFQIQKKAKIMPLSWVSDIF